MAKGKHSTALFEVINRPARTAVTPPPVVTRAPHNVAPAAPPAPSQPAGPSDPAVQLDPDRHQISFRISYTSALVTAFAVVVVVALAYMVGRGFGHSPQIANASTEDLKKGPANPAVLEVSSSERSAAAAPAVPTPAARAVSAVPQPVTASGPLAAPTNVKRIVGQNYIIMQSYPEEATAKEAQSVLLSNGISCTVEKSVPGFGSGWYSVVGTEAFDHVTKNPQLEAYLKSIRGVKYGEKSKFKKFDPQAFRWK